MSKTEIKVTIRCKFPDLGERDSVLLEEFATAVEYRLSQVRQPFNEKQCLKSWEAYKAERSTVYNALAAQAAK